MKLRQKGHVQQRLLVRRARSRARNVFVSDHLGSRRTLIHYALTSLCLLSLIKLGAPESLNGWWEFFPARPELRDSTVFASHCQSE